MQTPLIKISSVNMDQRAQLGVKPGDTVRVWQKIKEKDKTRLQVFEGLVLAHKHGNEPGATFTVRKIASGVGVEKVFPLYSPMIDKIEIIKRAKVRRAKLYYIREKAAREIRRQMRKMQVVDIATKSDMEEQEAAQKAEAEKIKEEENKNTAVTEKGEEKEVVPESEKKDKAVTEEETPPDDTKD